MLNLPFEQLAPEELLEISKGNQVYNEHAGLSCNGLASNLSAGRGSNIPSFFTLQKPNSATLIFRSDCCNNIY